MQDNQTFCFILASVDFQLFDRVQTVCRGRHMKSIIAPQKR